LLHLVAGLLIPHISMEHTALTFTGQVPYWLFRSSGMWCCIPESVSHPRRPNISNTMLWRPHI